jgi:hypothetical protein
MALVASTRAHVRPSAPSRVSISTRRAAIAPAIAAKPRSARPASLVAPRALSIDEGDGSASSEPMTFTKEDLMKETPEAASKAEVVSPKKDEPKKDEPKAESPAPPPPAPAPSAWESEEEEEDPDAEERSRLIRKLLGLAAASSRGQQASRDAKATMEDIITELEFMNPTEEPARKINGEWALVYASVEAFRSSPFFWGFQKMLPGGEDLASQLFKFTAGLPVAGTRGPFGVISQTVSLESEEMVSEVEMKIFDPFFAVASGVSGTVVSTANVTVKPDGAGDVLLVTPRTTRVRNSNVGGAILDQIVVPTSELMSSVAGGAVEAEATVTYVDDAVRIVRVGKDLDQIFVYTKMADIM